MLNNAVPVIDAETEQFHDDLLQSVREFKEGNFARVTEIETGNANIIPIQPLTADSSTKCAE